jgi:hypothetical protein
MCNSPCFRHLVLQCDSKVDFQSQRSLVQEHIPLMLSKVMEEYVGVASHKIADMTLFHL